MINLINNARNKNSTFKQMFIKPLVNCLKTLVNQYNSSLTTKPKILHDSKNQD